MRKYLLRGLGIAGVVYALMNYFYGQAEYADFGISMVSTSLLTWLAPLVSGVVLPALATKFPKVAGLAMTLWDMWKGRKTAAVKPDLRAKLEDLLDLELEAMGDPASETAVATLRRRAIERYKSA